MATVQCTVCDLQRLDYTRFDEGATIRGAILDLVREGTRQV
jgi:hypothetical protein